MAGDGIDRLVEERIREARARGELDDLPGHGRPLDLDDLAGLTPEQRFAALVSRNMGGSSPQDVILQEIRECRAELLRPHDEAERERLRAKLRASAAELSELVKASRPAR